MSIWLNDFKKALILQETAKLESLMDQMPQFSTLHQMEEAAYLLLSVKTLLENERSNALHSLSKLKKTIDFLKTTEVVTASSINLKL
jgi:flagellar hook assembly protein FlgD